MASNKWKIVFNAWGVLFVVTIVTSLMNGRIDPFNITILAISLTGLHGLAFDKTIWTQRFWRIFFIALMALTGIILVVVSLSLITNLTNSEPVAEAVTIGAWQIIIGGIYLFFYGLQLYGLYLYPFKRNALWQRQD